MLSQILLIAIAATQFSTLQPSHLVLDGSANIGHWRCRSNALDAQLQIDASMAEIDAAGVRVASETVVDAPSLPLPRFRLRVPVERIRCANRVMEREMSQALRGSEFPAIEFELKEVRGPISYAAAEGGRYQVTVAGDLTVAGTTRRLHFPISAWRLPGQAFYVRTSIPLSMRDFGVEPPTSLFGLIRARSEITVYFDLRLTLTGNGSSAPNLLGR